jgi:TatD DNase family protein
VELFDAHCHLEMPPLFASAPQIVERAKRAGVVGIVVSAIEPEFYPRAIALMERFSGFVWVTLGLHPPRTSPHMVSQCIALIRQHADRIVGIGEVGLDYYWVKDSRQRNYQRDAFLDFIELAAELSLPIVVHSRDAENDAVTVLCQEQATRVQLHCFNDPNHVAQAAARKWFMSVPTSVVTRAGMQHVAELMPLANMLLETDAPYLAPFPNQRNEPSNLPHAAAKIAELKVISPEAVAKATTENALQLFRLERGSEGLQRC